MSSQPAIALPVTVLAPIGADIPPPPDDVVAFKEALAKCRQAEDQLRRVMHAGGWLS